ncbi:ATP synthase F1 subunit delta [Bartonella henselae]|uniref:ATP synthase F1 subunit delta n=1 Tax=Bartonella henselae TaxID=38323 RepID=UPI0003DF82C4|nr:ATP synthase F1 subunit delta [Bartonella henselae]ETS10838.1 ATP synthase subunit delta [Bartonella henselae JK 42]ETS12928.1 ATP synthase subunit delta [Bartonella henselae JK 41]KEC58869.1 ATP synthase subunit delta [Bartonella henselae str. Zeus]KEC60899.1 ATP synthase subunit delta [Bartonella henselae JK 53]MDM9983343.1 ATP synthase F1 subunit delta [Bartonella henselae]
MSNSFSLIPLPLVDQRYAQALFDLAQEEGLVEILEKAVESFLMVLDQDEDLKHFVQSPFFSVKEQVKVMHSVCENIPFADEGAGQILSRFLRVITLNHRLRALSGILHAFQRCVALSRREFSAQIIAARPLNSQQKQQLQSVLESVVGGKVFLNICVDPEILGGLIIRLGSSQIDTSLMAKLSSLKIALKKRSADGY